MKGLKFSMVAALLALAVARPAEATEVVTGRWADDASACGLFAASAEHTPLIVTDSALRWHDDACRIAREYKTGDTIHIQALCRSFTGEHSVPVSLRPHGGMLTVTWNRGRQGDFRRCR